MDTSLSSLRAIWEETSDRFEAMQMSIVCVEQQAQWRNSVTDIKYSTAFEFGTDKSIARNQQLTGLNITQHWYLITPKIPFRSNPCIILRIGQRRSKNAPLRHKKWCYYMY